MTKDNSTELTAKLPQSASFGTNHSYCGLEMRNKPQEDLLGQRLMPNDPDNYCLPSNMAYAAIGDLHAVSLAEAMVQLLETTSNEGVRMS